MEGLPSAFKFNIILLIPPAIILYLTMSKKKKPTIPGMLISSFAAVLIAVFYQGMPVVDAVDTMVLGYTSHTGVEVIDTLLTKGGMLNMMDVALIALCSFSFAGIAHTAGMLIASVSSSSILVAFMTGSSYLTLLIPGELFSPAFKKMGLAAKNLSRTIEDSGTVVVPLVP
jgi:NhaC family Na+:H+ antiporter